MTAMALSMVCASTGPATAADPVPVRPVRKSFVPTTAAGKGSVSVGNVFVRPVQVDPRALGRRARLVEIRVLLNAHPRGSAFMGHVCAIMMAPLEVLARMTDSNCLSGQKRIPSLDDFSLV